ncbi:MAG: response regulator [Deltaproteobacteria bacterium]|nr:response regulator [Deltaproteobacteria bacterium]MDI6762181.1 response regulator [Thermodesulfobacteriota bacterium]
MAYNVLIVDDSQTMRKVIRKTVSISGFEIGDCWEAGNGREALDILHSCWVDLILADLNMPVMNGLEMLRELKKGELHRHIPVILITTEGSEKRLEEAYALGIKGYIQKPFYPETIRDVLTRIMEETRD